MVDEFQDVNEEQFMMAEILSAYHKNLFIVGDGNQTIYTWRGSKMGYIMDFAKIHEDAATYTLTRNYRSTPQILNASNRLIRNNRNRTGKDLVAVREDGEPARFAHFNSNREEAEWIADRVREMTGNGIHYKDIAILYRSGFVSNILEEVFEEEGIPHIIYGGLRFYDRDEIKTALAYLRMVIRDDDDSFLRTVNEPRRGFGIKKLEIIKAIAAENGSSLFAALSDSLEHPEIRKAGVRKYVELIEDIRSRRTEMSPSEVMDNLLKDSGYEEAVKNSGDQDRLDNLAELKKSLSAKEKQADEDFTIEEYLQEVALYSNPDKKQETDSVRMMTVHAAKGLEFPVVFVAELCEGIFPNRHASTDTQMEEERRLCYVAYTRAKDILILTDSEETDSEGWLRTTSRFIAETGNCLEFIRGREPKYAASTVHREAVSQERVYGIGDRIRHNIYGMGTILAIKWNEGAYLIKFESLSTDRELSFSAPLVPLRVPGTD